MASHRLRKASLRGADIMAVNPRDFGFNFRIVEQAIRAPYGMVETLTGAAKAVLSDADAVPRAIEGLLTDIEPDATAKRIAGRLQTATHAGVLLGPIALHHPYAAVLRGLSSVIAARTGARLGYLPDGANAAGAWLAGCLPHRGPAGELLDAPGLHAGAMLEQPRRACLLFGVEPELDCDDPSAATAAMQAAEFVAVCTPFAGEAMREYADVLLPVASFAETAGTFVNAEGRWQSFNAAVPPPGEARPGWKLLRVLGNTLGLDGFDYTAAEQARDELKALFSADLRFDNRVPLSDLLRVPRKPREIARISTAPIYAGDPLLRRANALQETADARDTAVRINSRLATALNLDRAEHVTVRQGGKRILLPLQVDDGVAGGTVWMPAGIAETVALGSAFGEVT
ncbi:MAG: molybdopterin-dependent oxidoreductase, partial [Planctomycetaceae bacterium]